MKQQRYNYSYIIFFLITASHLVSPCLCDDVQGLINQICSQTSDYGLCFTLLNRAVTLNVKDLKGFIKLTVEFTLAYSTETRLFIQIAIDSRETSEQLKKLYGGCHKNYEVVVRSLKSANISSYTGDYRKMVASLKDCTRPIIVCQSAINVFSREMYDRNRKMRDYLTMGLYEGEIV